MSADASLSKFKKMLAAFNALLDIPGEDDQDFPPEKPLKESVQDLIGCCLDDLSAGKQDNVDIFAGNPAYEFIRGDLKDFDTCMRACRGADYVLHQAAWGAVPRSLEMLLFFCANNVSGTLNMLEAVRRNQVRKIVYASSSSVYGDTSVSPRRKVSRGSS